MIVRTLIVDAEAEYSDKEVIGIRRNLDPSCDYQIIKRQEGGLTVIAPIEDSVNKVMHNIGEAYISSHDGVSE